MERRDLDRFHSVVVIVINSALVSGCIMMRVEVAAHSCWVSHRHDSSIQYLIPFLGLASASTIHVERLAENYCFLTADPCFSSHFVFIVSAQIEKVVGVHCFPLFLFPLPLFWEAAPTGDEVLGANGLFSLSFRVCFSGFNSFFRSKRTVRFMGQFLRFYRRRKTSHFHIFFVSFRVKLFPP